MKAGFCIWRVAAPLTQAFYNLSDGVAFVFKTKVVTSFQVFKPKTING